MIRNGSIAWNHYDQIDGSIKEFGLSMQGLTRSWEKTRAEADKCVLLCANCHREVHGGIAEFSITQKKMG